MRIQDRLFASLGCCCQGWPDQREGQNNPGRNRPSGHALICRPPGEEQPWKVGPLPSRMRPRAISPFPIGGSFGLPASGPPRLQPTALSRQPSATLGTVEKKTSGSRRMQSRSRQAARRSSDPASCLGLSLTAGHQVHIGGINPSFPTSIRAAAMAPSSAREPIRMMCAPAASIARVPGSNATIGVSGGTTMVFSPP
jgi:hypothetical protein